MSRLHTACRRITSLAYRGLLASVAILASVIVAAPMAHGLESDLVASGFNRPVFVTAPLGDPRLFVVERSGTIKMVDNGAVSTFLDIRSQVTSNAGELGLLGLAFDPNYSTNHRFFVDYIDKSNHTVIASFQANGDVALPTSQSIVLSIPQTNATNHKAGWIGFRPGEASNLYIATGDGGGGYDTFQNGQNKNTLLGKILRINVNPPAGSGPYTIPAGNAFPARPGAPEIWAYGLRNPYRNSFDSANGNFYIGDVGQDTREEVDLVKAGNDPNHPGGVNFGWPLREGKTKTPGDTGGAVPDPNGQPIYDYGHNGGPFDGEAIIGGYVYRGSAMPQLDGTYFFGDLTGKIWSYKVGADGSFIAGTLTDRTAELVNAVGIGQITSFGEDGLHKLYVVDYGTDSLTATDGRIFALVPEPGTWLMLAAGLMSVGWVARRRLRA
jgi:glucose/arabinose dehydrogenase